MGLASDRALAIRHQLGVKERIANRRLPDLANLCGVPVRRRPLGELDGVYSGRHIVLNTQLAPPQMRWTFGHELSHHLFDVGNDCIDRFPEVWVPKAKRERRAELFTLYLFAGEVPAKRNPWQMAETYNLPVDRIARALDLHDGWLAISSPDASLNRYRRLFGLARPGFFGPVFA